MKLTRQHVALLAILVLAAALRFAGLSWGLRHIPHEDERVFVDHVRIMAAKGDLDHRYYEYPGLFFYILRFALALTPSSASAGTSFWVGRSVVAAFGVMSVGLAYVLGRRMVGPSVGLLAGLFAAVSPVAVETAHMIRPDVVLESFSLLALLTFLHVGSSLRNDALAGATLGMAMAVKFSGALLVPSYLCRRLLASGRRGRALLLASVVALVVFVVLTPYSVLNLGKFVDGAWTQVSYHYQDRPRESPGYLEMLHTYLIHPRGTLREAFGTLGVVLAVLGLVSVGREWRKWLPLAVFPLVTVAVFSTAEVYHDRFLVPCLGVIAVFVAQGVQWTVEKKKQAAWILATIAVAVPLWSSLTVVRSMSRPGTRDLALDWIEANVPTGSRVFSDVEDLGFDQTRLEILWNTESLKLDRLLAVHADLVVVANPEKNESLLSSFHRFYLAEPENPFSGPPIGLYASSEELRPSYVRAPISGEWLSASENAEKLPNIIDGRRITSWETEGPQRPGSWLQVTFPEPVVLGRIELLLGAHPLRFGRNLHLFVDTDGSWRRVRYVGGRPPVRRQVPGGEGPSEVLIVEPVRTRGVRIEQVGKRAKSWSVAEMRVDLLEALP